MSEQLDAKTFDLVGVLSGRDYPVLDVPVYFNEVLGFKIQQVKKELAAAELRDVKTHIKKLDKELSELVKASNEERYVIQLKSIPESVRRSVVASVQEEFPEKTNLLGQAQPNAAADEAFTKKMWQAYIQTVTSPDGAVKVVDDKDIEALYSNAPITVHQQITEGIRELQTGALSGFEYAAKEVDFLSQASPEG